MPRPSSRTLRRRVNENQWSLQRMRPTNPSSGFTITAKHKVGAALEAIYLETSADDTDDFIGDRHDGRQSPTIQNDALNTAYDPFLINKGSLSPRQLSLVHTYIRDLAPMTFGIPRGTIYVPANHITQLCLQYSASGALWTAILAEEMIHTLSGQPRTHQMIVQKAAGRKMFMDALRTYRTDFQDAWIALIKVAQVSLWFGDKKSQSIQWTAADMLITSVGGLRRALALSPDIEPNYIASPFYWVRSLIAKREVLAHAVTRFLKSLNFILQQSKPQRSMLARPSQPVNQCFRSDREHSDLEADVVQSFEPFTKPLSGLQVAPERFRLVLLLELCWVFVSFNDNPRLLTEALSQIKRHFWGIPHSHGQKELELRPAPYAVIVGHARRQAIQTGASFPRAESDFLLTQMEIDGSSTFDYLTPQSRYLISTKLYTWLGHSRDDTKPLTATEMSALVEEALHNWYVPEHSA